MTEHETLVLNLAKPGADILNEMTPEMAHLLHMALGIAGEAGEIVDAVKKTAIYGKALDIENLVEELGDLEFYMEGLRQGISVSRETCLAQNIEKLQLRYGKTYSDHAAIERKDKK